MSADVNMVIFFAPFCMKQTITFFIGDKQISTYSVGINEIESIFKLAKSQYNVKTITYSNEKMFKARFERMAASYFPNAIQGKTHKYNKNKKKEN